MVSPNWKYCPWKLKKLVYQLKLGFPFLMRWVAWYYQSTIITPMKSMELTRKIISQEYQTLEKIQGKHYIEWEEEEDGCNATIMGHLIKIQHEFKVRIGPSR